MNDGFRVVRAQERLTPMEKPPEPVTLLAWDDLRRRIIDALGIDKWPQNVLEVCSNAEGAQEVEQALRQEVAMFESILLEDFLQNLESTSRLRHWLAYLEKKQTDSTSEQAIIGTERLVAVANKRLRLLEKLLHERQTGLVLFVVRSEELSEVLEVIEKMSGRNLRFVMLLSDPPHTWNDIAEQNPAIPFLELEHRKGIEMVSKEARIKSRERILNLLSPCFELGLIPNDLVRAVRKLAEPSSDIAIEREVIKKIRTTDHAEYKTLLASRGEREERWKRLSSTQKQQIAHLVDVYTGPRSDGRAQYEYRPEIHAEAVLRLAVLDSDCLPEGTVFNAKRFFSEYFARHVQAANEAEAASQSTALQAGLCAVADRALLSPLVYDAYRPLLEYRARVAVEAVLWPRDGRTSVLVSEAYVCLARARQAGCDISRYETQLNAINTRLLTKALPVKEPSPEERLRDLDETILDAMLLHKPGVASQLLAEKDELLRPERQSPTVHRSDMLGAMSILMNKALDTTADFERERDVLNRELRRRLAVIENPTPSQIEKVNELVLNEWRVRWTKRHESDK